MSNVTASDDNQRKYPNSQNHRFEAEDGTNISSIPKGRKFVTNPWTNHIKLLLLTNKYKSIVPAMSFLKAEGNLHFLF